MSPRFLAALVGSALTLALILVGRAPDVPAGGAVLPVAALGTAAAVPGSAEPTGAPAAVSGVLPPVDGDVSTAPLIAPDVAERLGRASASAPVMNAVTAAPAAVYYENCDAVRAAGAAPILDGTDGYRAGLDSDSDGIGCEITGDSVVTVAHTDYYANCAEVEAAGMAPLREGDRGYRAGLDRDSDGIACEQEPTSPGTPVTVPPTDPAGEDPREPERTDEEDLSRHDDPTDDEQIERDAEKHEPGSPGDIPGYGAPTYAPDPGDPGDTDE